MPVRLRATLAKARAASEAGDAAEAAKCYGQAAETARLAGLPAELAFCLRHLAQALLETDRAQDALDAAMDASQIYDESEPVRGMNYANTARLIALAREGLGQTTEAQSSWVEARAIYEIHGVEEGVAECDAHLRAAA